MSEPMEREIPSLPNPRLGDLAYAAVVAGLPSGAIISLIAFAKSTDADGTTTAAVRGVARDLGLSSGTVARHVGLLVDLGFLEQLGRPRSDMRRRRWRVAGMDQGEDEISVLLRSIPSTSPEAS
jgi:DNA-binding MarR family transcriptional regulator